MSIKTKCFSKSVTSVILSLCMIFSCISVSLIPTSAARVESESVGTTVPVGKTFYLDVTNFSGDYNSGYYMSLSGNGSTAANKDDTTGVPSYVPKNDSSWVQMTQLRGNIYKGTTTAESTNGRISFWSKNGSSYDNVWEMNVSLGNSYDESKNMFVVSSGKTTHDSRHTDCFSGTWESYMPDIYFLNNHGWSNVYVLLFNAAQWNNTYGVQANQNVEHAQMTRVGNTDVYKYSPTKLFTHVAFVANDQYNYQYLYQTEAAYASGCSESHPLYIPGSASKTVNQTVYYNADGNGNDINGGYWTSYSEGDAPYSGMSLYIAGRFHVRTIDTGNQWINSFDTGDWSDTGDDNIALTYVSGSTYKLETHASLSDLSSLFDGKYVPYFYIYDKGNQKYWYAATEQALTSSTQTASLSRYNSKSSSVNNKLRFNDQSTAFPVTMFFDVATGELRYSVPAYYDVDCPATTGGTVSADPTRQKAGGEVALTVTPAEGYSLSSLVVKDVSNQTVTVTNGKFIMPASAVTVTATFAKNSYDLTMASTQNGSFSLSANQAQMGDTVTVTCTPAADYEVDTVTYNGTAISGTGNTRTFTMPAQDTTVAVTFKEKKYAITVQNDGHGTVTRGGSTVTGTTEIGNVTPVTLKAENFTGYAFDHWAITTDTATQATVNGTTVTLTEGEQSVSDAPLQSTFKFNGTATVKAYFKAVDYSIVVNFAATYAAGNSIRICDANDNDIQVAHYQQPYKIIITLADAYELPSNPFSGTGLTLDAAAAMNPEVSENVYTYHCVMGDAALNANPTGVDATVTLAAKAPEITDVQVKGKNFDFVDSSFNTFDIYYLQPLVAKATANTFTQLSYTDAVNTQTSASSGTAVTLAARSDKEPDDREGTSTYTLTVTATNCPPGIAAANAKTDQKTYTIRVSFNAAQMVHYDLVQLYDRCLQEEDLDTSYFEANAPLDAYRTAYSAATTEIGKGYPAYNANAEDKAEQQGVYDELHTQYLNLIHTVKTTTVYVLSKYDNTKPMLLHVWTSGSDAAKNENYLKMYASENGSRASHDTYRMTYDGTFTKDGDRYLYKFTYAGHIDFLVWRGASDTDVSMADSEKLTQDVTWATEFKEYYIDLWNTDMSDSPPAPTEKAYVDFDLTKIVTIQNNKKLYTCTKEILKYRIAGMQMKEVQISHTLCSPEALKTPLKNQVRQNAQSSVRRGIAKGSSLEPVGKN